MGWMISGEQGIEKTLKIAVANEADVAHSHDIV
jgi:hypothetical protein